MHLPRTALCAVLLASTTAFATDKTDGAAVKPRAWEHETSDIPADPGTHFGALQNGMRYAWRKNGEPKDRCYAWLHVDVGSLAEDDSEQGMAHFLEHMAFNGSEHFPAGTLIQWLQEHGLDFGADSNAHTAFSETVYTLNLPSSDAKMVREGLTVLSDMAGRLTLSQKEIDAEKGVIDGEERERDSAAARLGIKTLQDFFAGSRLALRIPIGKKEMRDKFSAESVRAFYSKWYRPDNMTLILVGDLGDLDPTPIIQEMFGSLVTPNSARPAEPALGKPTYEKPFYNRSEAEIPVVQVEYGHYSEFVDRPFDKATLTKDLALNTACSMLNRRFAEKSKAGKAPYLGAAARYGALDGVYRGLTLSLAAEPKKWQDAFKAAELEFRGAIEFGFQDEELRVQRAERTRALDEAVKREKTRSSQSYAQDLAAAAENPVVPAASATIRDILKPAYAELTPEACKAALAKAATEGKLGMQCLGNVDLGNDAATVLESLLAESEKQVPAAPEKLTAGKFAYASDPAHAGKIASRTTANHDVEEVIFENGVVAKLKKTDFKQREVRLAVSFGEGELSSRPEDSALRFVAADAVNGAGLEAHDEDQLRRVLAGKAVSVSFGISDASFGIVGSSATDDLLTCLELAAASIEHCGWREDGLLRLLREVPQQYESLGHSLDGPYAMQLERELYSGDPRFGAPSLAEVQAIDMKQVRAWIEPQFKSAPIQVVLVGDFDVDAAVNGLAQTFGNLGSRRARQVDPKRLEMPRLKTGARLTAQVDTKVPGALVLGLFQANDALEPSRRRDQHFLARVLQDRVLNVVREKLGASYSPQAYDELSPTYPGMGRFVIRAEGDPKGVDALAKAVVEVGESLGKDGITDEEVSRLREPLLKDLRDQKRQNAFWLQSLERTFTTPTALDDALTAEAYYQSLDAKHLTDVAKRYFAAGRASVVAVTPKESGSAGDKSEKKGTR